MPSKLFFAYQQALRENNQGQLEIVLDSIVLEMAEVEKDFVAELQALKNDSQVDYKEGLFEY